MSPTLSGLQSMLNVCEKYGNVFYVNFNAKKTKCMRFSKCNYYSMNDVNVSLCDQRLSWVNEFKYLGNWVTTDLSEDIEINHKLGVFFAGVNNLCSTFKSIGVKHSLKLFYSYCCHFYGSQAWRLRDKNIGRMFTAWNKAVRHICNISPRTHTYYLPYILGQLHVTEDIYLRTRKMILSMINSKNMSINFLARSNIDNNNSLLGDNWNFINNKLQIDDNCENAKAVLVARKNESFTAECSVTIELLDVLDDYAIIENFDKDDIREMLLYMCTI